MNEHPSKESQSAQQVAYHHGEELFRRGEYEQALVSFKQSVEMYKRLLPGEPSEVEQRHWFEFSRNYRSMARAYMKLGTTGQAVTYYQEYVRIFECIYTGNKHKLVARLYHIFGNDLCYENHIETSIDMYREGIRALNDSRAPRRSSTYRVLSSIYCSLGEAYDRLGDYDQAIANLQASIQSTHRRRQPARHRGHIIHCNHLLALASFKKGRPDQAIAFLAKVIENFKAYDDPATSFDLARRVVDMGHMLEECGYKERSIAIFQTCIELFEFQLRVPGWGPLGLASIYQDLRHAYSGVGNFEKAHVSLKTAIDIFTENEPGSAWSLSTCYLLMGQLYLKQNAFDDAVSYFGKAAEIESGMPLCTSTLPDIYRDLGSAYRTGGDYNQAIHCIERTIAFRECHQAKAPLRLAQCYKLLGGIHDDLGEYFQAVLCYQKAIMIYEKASPDYLDFELYQKLGIAAAAALLR